MRGSTYDAGSEAAAGDGGVDAPLADALPGSDAAEGGIVTCLPRDQVLLWQPGQAAHAMALTATHLLWTGFTTGEIHYVARGGGAVASVPGFSSCVDLAAFDTAGGTSVYFTYGAAVPPSLAYGPVGGPQQIFNGKTLSDVAVEPVTGTAYAAFFAGFVSSWSMGIAQGTPHATLGAPARVAIEPRGNTFFVGESTGQIEHFDGTAFTVVRDNGGTAAIGHIALDPSDPNGLYWVENGSSGPAVFHGTRSGPNQLPTPLGAGSELAVNTTYAFFGGAAGIYRHAHGDATAPALVPGTQNATAIVADDQCAYFSSNTTIEELGP